MRKYLAVLSLLTMVVWMTSCGALEERRRAKQQAEADEKNQMVDSSEIAIVEEIEEDTTATNVVVVSEEKTEVTTDNTAGKKFYVIVGSFKKESNAKVLYSKLSESGVPSEILESDSEFKRVSKKAFDTREEAMQELERVRSIDKQTDAWILTSK